MPEHLVCVRKKVDNTVNVNVRLSQGLVNEIDREINQYNIQNNRTEFVKDAIKFYLNSIRTQRIESSKMKTEITVTDETDG
jgi:metal-responsive CopG/Arc/MetJ family transcriptional regulator